MTERYRARPQTSRLWILNPVSGGQAHLIYHLIHHPPSTILRRFSWPSLAYMCTQFSGFVKLKKIQKSEKNSKVGGWVKPKLEFLFSGGIFFFFFFCVVFMFPNVSKKNIKNCLRVGGVWLIRIFLRFLDFFKLDTLPKHHAFIHFPYSTHIQWVPFAYIPLPVDCDAWVAVYDHDH